MDRSGSWTQGVEPLEAPDLAAEVIRLVKRESGEINRHQFGRLEVKWQNGKITFYEVARQGKP